MSNPTQSIIYPKTYFLCHYPQLLRVYGPLRDMWCMRFEAYHQYIKAIVNFKNVCKTLTERNQLRKCWEQSGNRSLDSASDARGCSAVIVSEMVSSAQECVSQFFRCSVEPELMSVSSVVISNVRYSVDDFFVTVRDICKVAFLHRHAELVQGAYPRQKRRHFE